MPRMLRGNKISVNDCSFLYLFITLNNKEQQGMYIEIRDVILIKKTYFNIYNFNDRDIFYPWKEGKQY